MIELHTYLTFNGNCADAMRFYERTLGGKLENLMTHAESPMAAQTPPGGENRILHARLVLPGGAVLMASDTMVGMPFEGMKGFAISLGYPTAAAGQPVFNALSDGGHVTMPFQKTFWAEGFGMLVDRYGVPWMINAGNLAA